jgi:hypothetical protein
MFDANYIRMRTIPPLNYRSWDGKQKTWNPSIQGVYVWLIRGTPEEIASRSHIMFERNGQTYGVDLGVGTVSTPRFHLREILEDLAKLKAIYPAEIINRLELLKAPCAFDAHASGVACCALCGRTHLLGDAPLIQTELLGIKLWAHPKKCPPPMSRSGQSGLYDPDKEGLNA